MRRAGNEESDEYRGEEGVRQGNEESDEYLLSSDEVSFSKSVYTVSLSLPTLTFLCIKSALSSIFARPGRNVCRSRPSPCRFMLPLKKYLPRALRENHLFRGKRPMCRGRWRLFGETISPLTS
jgi:hypothetical protein